MSDKYEEAARRQKRLNLREPHEYEMGFLAGAEWALKDLEEKVKSGEIIQSVEQFRRIYFPEAPKEEG